MGAMTVLIGGDVSGLDKAAAKAQGIVGGLTKSIGSGAAQLVSYAAAATAAGVALAIGLTAKSMDTIDAQSKLAYRLNGSVKELQSLVHAGDLAGVSQEVLAQNIGKMNARLAEAARTGEGPAYEALKRLGLGASEFLQLPVNERLAVLADRFKTLGYTTAQQADALKQFGIRGQEIISLFEGGGDTIRDASKDVEAFGVAVSDIDAAQVEIANDAWTTAKLLFTGIGNQLATKLAPLIKVLGDNFADAGRESGGFAEGIEKGVRAGVVGFGRLQKEVYTFRVQMDDAIAAFINGWNTAAGAIPKFMEWASGGAVTAAQMGYRDIEHGFGKLRETLAEPPSEADWDKWWESIQAKSREAAKKIVDERSRVNNGGGADTGDGIDDGQRKRLQSKLEQLQRSIATEDEALRLQHDRQLKDLSEFEAKRLVTAEEAATMRLEIQKKYEEAKDALVRAKFEQGVISEDELLAQKYAKQLADLEEFEKNRTITVERAAELRRKIEEKAKVSALQLQASQYSGLASIVDTSMGQMTDLIGQEGDKQFGIFKAISAATALVKGYEAVVSAYAAGSKLGGPVLGAAFAGIAAAGVAAHIAKLMSVNVNSGGGAAGMAAGGGGGSAATAAASQPAAPQQTMFLNVQGSFFGREQVRELAGKLIEFQGDGGKVVLA